MAPAKFAATLMAAIWLAVCASIAPTPLTLTDAASMRLTAVDVQVPESTQIWWGDAERDYAAAERKQGSDASKRNAPIVTGSIGGVDGHSGAKSDLEIADSPEGRAYVRRKLADRLKQSLESELKPALVGQRPVRIEATVHSFVIPSVAQRVAFGETPLMSATVELKDAETGAVLATRKDLVAAAASGNGLLAIADAAMFSGLDERLANSFAAEYKAWLIPKT